MDHQYRAAGILASLLSQFWRGHVQKLCPEKCVHCPANDNETPLSGHFCLIPGIPLLGTFAAIPGGVNADKITLRISGNCWIAQHHGSREAELLDLFGTTALPTCFTSLAPAAEVQREIARLNPDCIVEVL
jgi:hypothetical protein